MQRVAGVKTESFFGSFFCVDFLKDKVLLWLKDLFNSVVVHKSLEGKDYQRTICCFHLLGYMETGLLDVRRMER